MQVEGELTPPAKRKRPRRLVRLTPAACPNIAPQARDSPTDPLENYFDLHENRSKDLLTGAAPTSCRGLQKQVWGSWYLLSKAAGESTACSIMSEAIHICELWPRMPEDLKKGRLLPVAVVSVALANSGALSRRRSRNGEWNADDFRRNFRKHMVRVHASPHGFQELTQAEMNLCCCMGLSQ